MAMSNVSLSANSFVYNCPWCQSTVITTESHPEVIEIDFKMHIRMHVYQDLVEKKISEKEASLQRQVQLKKYLATILDIDKPQEVRYQ